MADISEIYELLSPEPLSGEGLDTYYVDAFKGRGDNPVMSLQRRLFVKPDGKLQILFSGYRGCGKSTELNKLQREISGENNEVVITVKEYYDTLQLVALSETKKVDNTGAALDLRQNLCILGYNDEGWCDVHPVVRSILQERKLIP
ncbi:MAG: hypothetical protein WBP54_02510 [Pelodictyon phaeoclathratiforme]